MMISSPTMTYSKPRHAGLISTMVSGTGASRTLVGMTVPTETRKSALARRGPPPDFSTVSRMRVFCSVVMLTFALAELELELVLFDREPPWALLVVLLGDCALLVLLLGDCALLEVSDDGDWDDFDVSFLPAFCADP